MFVYNNKPQTSAKVTTCAILVQAVYRRFAALTAAGPQFADLFAVWLVLQSASFPSWPRDNDSLRRLEALQDAERRSGQWSVRWCVGARLGKRHHDAPRPLPIYHRPIAIDRKKGILIVHAWSRLPLQIASSSSLHCAYPQCQGRVRTRLRVCVYLDRRAFPPPIRSRQQHSPPSSTITSPAVNTTSSTLSNHHPSRNLHGDTPYAGGCCLLRRNFGRLQSTTPPLFSHTFLTFIPRRFPAQKH